MLLHVGSEEGADRDDLQPAFRAASSAWTDESRTDALSLVRSGTSVCVNMILPAGQSVLGDRDAAVAKVDLEAMTVRIVADDEGFGCHVIRLACIRQVAIGQAKPLRFAR
jgi:hypothetical protein